MSDYFYIFLDVIRVFNNFGIYFLKKNIEIVLKCLFENVKKKKKVKELYNYKRFYFEWILG